MHPNAELIHRFYTAFGRRDHETMATCYRADAEFSDPVFQHLEGPEIGAIGRSSRPAERPLTRHQR